MPGILPMKVIKVGVSSQSRIAQACDRCRSKKIRCDGIRPTCTQCANVGFECRTSDKLSRRAFPRGYTESLEERVRVLEGEVRDLKDLLDEKDEKIDMLSKIHGNGSHRRLSIGSGSAVSPMTSPAADAKSGREPTLPRDDTFRVQASPLLLGVENSDSYYMGPSSGRGFIEAFKRKLQETGRPCSDFNTEAFLRIQGCYPLVNRQSSMTLRVPPRLFSDRCVNIYFQEWAPLFPVLHKPTFLRVYEDWVAEPEKMKSNHKLAQLYLVFGIASLSSENPDVEQIAACEQQWQRSLQTILMDDTMETLQCLVLALTYCQVRADNKRLQHYKCLAVGLSHRLGLHQSQKRFSFGALTIETRKKVFWTLYTLDCFSAATLGLPKLVKEEDVHTEYPNDVDDEYVTEKGFLPTLPGESTRLSSALALFRSSRILSKVLEKNYPAATSHELSLQQMSALEDELDEWCNNLPQHLKLTFKQDKPSTDITGSRSPLLAIAYYYIRTLIYRPAVGSSLGSKAASAVLSLSESSKHIIQIAQLLEERSMSFSFCLNKADLSVLCGMSLLYQSLELKQDSKMMKENERLVNVVLKTIARTKAPGSYELKRAARLVINIDEPESSLPTPPGQSPDTTMAAPPPRQKSPTSNKQRKSSSSSGQPQHYSIGRHSSMSETDLLSQQEKLKRMTMPNVAPAASTGIARQGLQRSGSRASLDGGRPSPASIMQRRDQRMSMSQVSMMSRISPPQQKAQADYLSLSTQSSQHRQQEQQQHQQQQHQNRSSVSPSATSQPFYSPVQVPQKTASGGMSSSEWEALLGQLDGGQANLYDAIYGGPQVSLEAPVVPVAPASVSDGGGHWTPDALDLSTFNLGDFGGASGNAEGLSEESLSSVSGGDDMGNLDFGDFSLGHHHHQAQGAMLGADEFIMEGMGRDGNFGM